MFSRFCNLCRIAPNVQFAKLQNYKKGPSKRNKYKSVRPVKISNNIEGKELIIKCKQKELNFHEGQTYSKFERIPLASNGWHHFKSKGDYFFVHPLTNITEEVNKDTDETDSFAQFGLDSRIIDNLTKSGITKPLRIQTTGIPIIMNGSNTIIAAETGCGKTLTYLLPMINKILHWKTLGKRRACNSPLGLIVTPSRELAVQLGAEAVKMCRGLDIPIKIITGGKTKKLMLNPSVGDVDIVVASFGVISKLTTVKIYKLDMIRYIVLDEADALFDETFEEKLKVFLKRVPIGFLQSMDKDELPEGAQLTLASATIPTRTSEILEEFINVESMKNITSEKLHHILVTQKFMRIGPSNKPMELLKYIKPKVANKESIIIFSNSSSTCYWVCMFLNNSNIETVQMNGSMPLFERQGKFAKFKSGRCMVLCTTNAGSRGLDTVMVRHVLNYEFPMATADYIHRCGRTGRVGSAENCRVTNFISTPSEIALVRKIEKATRKMKPIPILDIYNLKENNFDKLLNEHDERVDERNDQQEFSIPF